MIIKLKKLLRSFVLAIIHSAFVFSSSILAFMASYLKLVDPSAADDFGYSFESFTITWFLIITLYVLYDTFVKPLLNDK